MNKLWLSIPTGLTALYAFALTYTQGLNLGVDIFFHLKIAEYWSHGQPLLAFQYAYSVDKTFYPPLFHWLLSPGIWLGIETQWTLWLQFLFPIFVVSSFMFLSHKLWGNTMSFIGGLLVLSSTAFLDRVVQPQPQGIDFLLLPLAFYCFLFVKKKWYLVSAGLKSLKRGCGYFTSTISLFSFFGGCLSG